MNRKAQRDSQRDTDGPVTRRFVQSCRLCHVGKCAVAVVAIDLSDAAFLQHAVGDHQVQPAVVIQVAPQGHEAGTRIVGAAPDGVNGWGL